MGSFTAILHVSGQQYRVTRFATAFAQATSARGQVVAKVRHGALELELDVPRGDHLLQWAATAHKALTGVLVVLDGTGLASEHFAFSTGYCIGYEEVFQAGNRDTGSYRCHLRLVDPAGFKLGSGNPSALAVPAARNHGAPPVAAASPTPTPPPGTVSTCPPDVTARLEAQVHIACDTQKSKCTGENTCAEILARIPIAMGCIAAREAIMMQCYGGGDDIHKEEVNKRKGALEKCRKLYQKKCGPLPEFETVPQHVPSRQQDTEPQPHKMNPAVPVGLTGAALLLYYLLYIAEGALIIL